MKRFVFMLLLTVVAGQACYAQLQFIENKGQWDSRVQYQADITNGAFFIEKAGYTVLLQNPAEKAALVGHGGAATTADKAARADLQAAPVSSPSSAILHCHAYKVVFLGASESALAIPEKKMNTYNNYFIGSDSSRWQRRCFLYQSVTYKDIYPNIDLHYYTNNGTLKYDFIVHPGGNVSDIKLKYEGADKLELQNKELVVGTSVGDVKELSPYAYQVQPEGRSVLRCRYILKKSIVSFKIDAYDPAATFIIDPALIFSTFTGSNADNWGYTATPGPDGSFFAGGIAFSNGYPVSPGAFQTSFNANYDIAIIKFSPDGSQRLYGTYLGGNGADQPHSMICDPQGNLVVAGRSNSFNYPVKPASIANQGPQGRYDIVVTKLSADGTAVIGSVKIGGTADDGVNVVDKESSASGANATNQNYGDDARSEVILDKSNNIYLASCTQSADFPTFNSPIQSSFQGIQDGVILKFAPDLSSVFFSTYFGGSSYDACFVLTISPVTGNLYVGGATSSTSLPGNTAGVIQSVYQGGACDGFVTEILSDGSAILHTTFEGTPGNDLVYGLKIDKAGFPYIMGTTTGNWPVMPATVYSNSGGKQFIAKLQPDLSGYIYSTVFGTNARFPNISPIAFLVDRCENVYVSGWGGAWDVLERYNSSGTAGLPITADAIKSATDGDDFYFFVLARDASQMLFGSFFGQNGGSVNDHVDGGTSRFDENGVIYQAICANCGSDASFPTTAGVWSTRNAAGMGCNEAAVKIQMNFTGVGANIKSSISGVSGDTLGCLPLQVNFYDSIQPGARTYIWDFNDGKRDTTHTGNVSHLFSTAGTFRVMLIAEDSSKCNIRDTAYCTIKVGINKATLAFDFQKTGACDNLDYVFTNNSTLVSGNFSGKGFVWNYGDGSPNDTLGLSTHTHHFPSVGTYVITMCAIDTFLCNIPVCIDSTINIAISVQSKFSVPSKICVGHAVPFANTSIGGTSYEWDFGDGTPQSTEYSPTHTYYNTGTYTVRLVVNDPNTCNKTDTVTNTITVLDGVTAAFNFSPVVPQVNTSVQFTNVSTGAIKYLWDFGDGTLSTEVNPLHQFNKTGTYNVCLIAYSEGGCSDTLCKQVSALVNSLLDVPSAFTPGSGGINSVIKVVGFGIGKMEWKIYNRWGQQVFYSTDLADGWDGTFKGAAQPTDVYTYTLDVNFTDGTSLRKTGDITLLR